MLGIAVLTQYVRRPENTCTRPRTLHTAKGDEYVPVED